MRDFRFRCARWLRRALLAIALALAGALPAHAVYPERPVTLLVPFAPGGANDIVGRIIADALSEALGQPVVVENRGGAGGNIGMGAVARAKPDGYTLLLAPSSFVVNPSLYKKVPYDPVKDFAPISDLSFFVVAIVVRADDPIDSVGKLIAAAKEKPDRFSYSTPGPGTLPHLVGELLKLRSGLDMVHVPYPGAGPAAQAVLSGTVPLAITSLSVAMPLIHGAKLRGLAVTGRSRWADLPAVPTLEEAGIPNAASEAWQGILAPAGTPPEIVERLAKELTAIVLRPQMRVRLHRAGFGVTGGGPEALRARIAEELPRWKAVIDKAGLKRD
jgi:tripartite-type tricarboxylate transporter receptor subunit TctC